MATTLNITVVDDKKRKSSRSYECRDAAISDGEAIALVDDYQALTKLQVIKATVTRELSGFSSTAPVAGSRITDTASLRALKSDGVGVYTFKIHSPKEALVLADGRLDTTQSAFSDFLENFDDGTGILAVAGDFYISDGEELKETDANQTTIVGGELDK